MKIIKYQNAETRKNSEKCEVTEYSFGDKDIDLGVAKITGRYPEKGYCLNLISKELIHVLEGSGVLHFENEKVNFSKGDSILIEANEKYYWEAEYCIVSMACTPAFSIEQYRAVD